MNLESSFSPYLRALERSGFDPLNASFYPYVEENVDAPVTEQLEYVADYFESKLSTSPESRGLLHACLHTFFQPFVRRHPTHRHDVLSMISDLAWNYWNPRRVEFSDIYPQTCTFDVSIAGPQEVRSLIDQMSLPRQQEVYAWFFTTTLCKAYRHGMLRGRSYTEIDIDDWLIHAPEGTWQAMATLAQHDSALHVPSTGHVYLCSEHVAAISNYPGALTYLWSLGQVQPLQPAQHQHRTSMHQQFTTLEEIAALGMEARMFYYLNYQLPETLVDGASMWTSLVAVCTSESGMKRLETPFYAWLRNIKLGMPDMLAMDAEASP